jgi:hypothetical protein
MIQIRRTGEGSLEFEVVVCEGEGEICHVRYQFKVIRPKNSRSGK